MTRFECFPYRVPVSSIMQSNRRAAPIIFIPCTLGRTWGARPTPQPYWLLVAVILRMVLVVLMPLTVGTISTRPPQVVISSAPTMVEVV
jgi:hypothetical protein